MTDNYHFSISGGGLLSTALAVAFAFHNHAVGYRVVDDKMVFYWTNADGMIPFPAPMNRDQIEGIIHAWLKNLDYGEKPDIDGSVGKGFHIFNEAWGHVDGEWQAFFAVEPEWLLYGK